MTSNCKYAFRLHSVGKLHSQSTLLCINKFNNKFKFIPRSFYKNIQLRLTINIKLEIKIEVQNYNSKIMQFNYKNYRTN